MYKQLKDIEQEPNSTTFNCRAESMALIGLRLVKEGLELGAFVFQLILRSPQTLTPFDEGNLVVSVDVAVVEKIGDTWLQGEKGGPQREQFVARYRSVGGMRVEVTKFPDDGVHPLSGQICPNIRPVVRRGFWDSSSHDSVEPFSHSSREVLQDIGLAFWQILTLPVVVDMQVFVVISTVRRQTLYTKAPMSVQVAVRLPGRVGVGTDPSSLVAVNRTFTHALAFWFTASSFNCALLSVTTSVFGAGVRPFGDIIFDGVVLLFNHFWLL